MNSGGGGRKAPVRHIIERREQLLPGEEQWCRWFEILLTPTVMDPFPACFPLANINGLWSFLLDTIWWAVWNRNQHFNFMCEKNNSTFKSFSNVFEVNETSRIGLFKGSGIIKMCTFWVWLRLKTSNAVVHNFERYLNNTLDKICNMCVKSAANKLAKCDFARSFFIRLLYFR